MPQFRIRIVSDMVITADNKEDAKKKFLKNLNAEECVWFPIIEAEEMDEVAFALLHRQCAAAINAMIPSTLDGLPVVIHDSVPPDMREDEEEADVQVFPETQDERLCDDDGCNDRCEECPNANPKED